MKPAVWILAIALLPTATQAAEICCACKGGKDPTAVTCLTADAKALSMAADDCTGLPSKTKLPDGWKCDKTPLAVEKCRTVSDSGVCTKAPTSAYTYSTAPGEAVKKTDGTPTKPAAPDIIPQLNVPIPGLTFTGGAAGGTLFSEYIAAAYRYGISIVAIFATVMFVFGAFQYLLGSALPQIARGRAIMVDAVVGMLMVMGATLILRTVNPATVTLTPLVLSDVKPVEIEPRTASGPEPFSSTSPTVKKRGADPALVDALKRASAELGFDACVAIAVCEHETGLRIDRWNGDYAGTPKASASYFGCGVGWYHLKPTKGIAWLRIHDKFPELPQESGPTAVLKPQIAELMTTNVDLMAYTAVAVMKRVGAQTVRGLDTYASGGGGTKLWAKKTNCTTNISVSEAAKKPAEGLAKGCIPPGYIAVTCAGSDCAICEKDNYLCTNVKVNSRSEFKGTCASDGKVCTAMDSTGFVKYVVQHYARIKTQYQCGR